MLLCFLRSTSMLRFGHQLRLAWLCLLAICAISQKVFTLALAFFLSPLAFAALLKAVASIVSWLHRCIPRSLFLARCLQDF